MNQDYLISNKTYDVLKRVVTIVLPGLAVLYLTLADLWDLTNPEAVAGTLTALAVFGGVLIKVADQSWDNSEDKYDGDLVTKGPDPDTGIPHLALSIKVDPNTLAAKDTVRLKSIDKTSD